MLLYWLSLNSEAPSLLHLYSSTYTFFPGLYSPSLSIPEVLGIAPNAKASFR